MRAGEVDSRGWRERGVERGDEQRLGEEERRGPATPKGDPPPSPPLPHFSYSSPSSHRFLPQQPMHVQVPPMVSPRSLPPLEPLIPSSRPPSPTPLLSNSRQQPHLMTHAPSPSSHHHLTLTPTNPPPSHPPFGRTGPRASSRLSGSVTRRWCGCCWRTRPRSTRRARCREGVCVQGWGWG